MPMLRPWVLLFVLGVGSVVHLCFFHRRSVWYIWRCSFPHRNCPVFELCAAHSHVSVVFSVFDFVFVIYCGHLFFCYRCVSCFVAIVVYGILPIVCL